MLSVGSARGVAARAARALPDGAPAAGATGPAATPAPGAGRGPGGAHAAPPLARPALGRRVRVRVSISVAIELGKSGNKLKVKNITRLRKKKYVGVKNYLF